MTLTSMQITKDMIPTPPDASANMNQLSRNHQYQGKKLAM